LTCRRKQGPVMDARSTLGTHPDLTLLPGTHPCQTTRSRRRRGGQSNVPAATVSIAGDSPLPSRRLGCSMNRRNIIKAAIGAVGSVEPGRSQRRNVGAGLPDSSASHRRVRQATYRKRRLRHQRRGIGSLRSNLTAPASCRRSFLVTCVSATHSAPRNATSRTSVLTQLARPGKAQGRGASVEVH